MFWTMSSVNDASNKKKKRKKRRRSTASISNALQLISASTSTEEFQAQQRVANENIMKEKRAKMQKKLRESVVERLKKSEPICNIIYSKVKSIINEKPASDDIKVDGVEPVEDVDGIEDEDQEAVGITVEELATAEAVSLMADLQFSLSSLNPTVIFMWSGITVRDISLFSFNLCTAHQAENQRPNL